MAYREFLIPGPVVPKARPRFDPRSGRAYTEQRYADWLDMATQTVALLHRGAPMDGNLLLRTAFTPAGVEVAIMGCSPVEYKGRRGDLDNMTGSVMDALQKGGAIVNDSKIVRLESWFV